MINSRDLTQVFNKRRRAMTGNTLIGKRARRDAGSGVGERAGGNPPSFPNNVLTGGIELLSNKIYIPISSILALVVV